MIQKTHRFNDGDKVILKDYETVCKNRKVSPNNEAFKRHYDYVKSKEPLTVTYFWEPGELTYSDDSDRLDLRGKKTEKYYYNIQTPRSKLYLFDDWELDPYIEKPDSDS